MKRMTTEQRRVAAYLAEEGCCVPKCEGIGLIHHEYSKARGFMKSHDRIACLCWEHHVGPTGRHTLGREAFDDMHNMNIWREAGYDL